MVRTLVFYNEQTNRVQHVRRMTSVELETSKILIRDGVRIGFSEPFRMGEFLA